MGPAAIRSVSMKCGLTKHLMFCSSHGNPRGQRGGGPLFFFFLFFFPPTVSFCDAVRLHGSKKLL